MHRHRATDPLELLKEHILVAGGCKGAKEPGVSKFAFKEGALWSYQEFCKDMVVLPCWC